MLRCLLRASKVVLRVMSFWTDFVSRNHMDHYTGYSTLSPPYLLWDNDFTASEHFRSTSGISGKRRIESRRCQNGRENRTSVIRFLGVIWGEKSQNIWPDLVSYDPTISTGSIFQFSIKVNEMFQQIWTSHPSRTSPLQMTGALFLIPKNNNSHQLSCVIHLLPAFWNIWGIAKISRVWMNSSEPYCF